MALDAHWRNEHDYYATGLVSRTDYDLDLFSDTVGRLISDVEAERRLRGQGRMHWTPHVRLDRTRISIESFTDAVGARASFSDEDRHVGSLGMRADTVRSAWGGELSLRGSLNLEHTFGGTGTTSRVSGETLRASPEENSVLVGFGALWQQGPWVLGSTLSTRNAPGSENHAYQGSVHVGMQF